MLVAIDPGRPLIGDATRLVAIWVYATVGAAAALLMTIAILRRA